MHYLYNGLPAAVEINANGGGEYRGQLRRNAPPEARAMIYAAGYAAEYWNVPLYRLRRWLWHYWPQIRHEWPDMAKLNKIFFATATTDRARYLQIRTTFITARRLLLLNRAKVQAAAALLTANKQITETDAETLFFRWRNS